MLKNEKIQGERKYKRAVTENRLSLIYTNNKHKFSQLNPEDFK
jgi:hypothetical protein